MAKFFPFSKYHGLGNHFIVVDNRDRLFDFTRPQLIREMCNPRTGIGADCLLEIIKCSHPDHQMCAYEIINHLPSGTSGGLCGNGSRCVAEFARKLGLVPDVGKFNFCGFDGVHWARHHLKDKLVEISIRDVWEIKMYDNNNYFVFTGSPHHVKFVLDVESTDVQTLGDEIRFDLKTYPKGCNVMFVQESEGGEITMRSYERSIDGETWACGTGTSAVALVTAFKQKQFGVSELFHKQINVRLGQLAVKGKRTGETKFENISLIGPTWHVFDGRYIFHDK